jgi:hypothetical protein
VATENNNLGGASARHIVARLAVNPPPNYQTKYSGEIRNHPSRSTIQAAIKAGELVIVHVRRIPDLSPENIQQRLDWCIANLLPYPPLHATAAERRAFVQALARLVDVD